MPENSAPTQQHWVPKFYLKEFAIPATKTQKSPKVCVIDKSGQISEPREMSVAKLCSKKHLYTPLDQDGDRDMTLEEEFSKMESRAAEYWGAFAAGDFGLICREQKTEVSRFLAAMHLRNKRLFDLYTSLMKNRDELIGGPRTEEADGTQRLTLPFEKDPDPTDPGRFFAQSTRQGIAKITDTLISYGWAVFHTDRDIILTSDTPVTFFNERGGRAGPGSENAHAIFPITPSSILYMRSDGRGADKPISLGDHKTIGFFNNQTMACAERFVILNHSPK